ncbi:MAG: IS701 family transposase [Candidatus Moranbacteria bacterium CG_4_8_14_3_um_filter_41_13]|nr:MAG: IS701 family transposase [Candidatus Moranbacteria bacterium CG_4_8_14_3_um_filter_41_13]
MNKQHLELYTDYLLSTFGYATATGLSRMVEGQVTHDQITRFLSAEELTSKDLWRLVKPTVREVEQEDAVLIFDDTIQEKPYTDENEVMCWHYDHTKGRAVQGFNLLNCLYHVNDTDIPVAFELIKKPVQYCDLKTRRLKRASLYTKNELMRNMLSVCVQNKLKFRFVLFDTWFSSKENMGYIKKDLVKDFICALKSNRLVAVSKEDYAANRFTPIEELPWQEETLFVGWLKDVPFPMSIVRQVFTNKDGSTGILYLACSDITVKRGQILATYQKRWPVEVFHKSLKQNAALGKAPVRRVVTQNNHVFAVLYAFFKLECLSIKRHLNHFALRAQLYLKAIRVAYDELQTLKAA